MKTHAFVRSVQSAQSAQSVQSAHSTQPARSVRSAQSVLSAHTIRPARSARSPLFFRHPQKGLLQNDFALQQPPKSVRHTAGNYLPVIFATSAAKSSTFFSRPSPFSRRANLTTSISVPISAETLLRNFATLMSPSLMYGWSFRQTSL